MNRLIDNLEGQMFGEWCVIEKIKPNVYGNTFWLVKCSCGKNREITGRSLRYGKSTHCGCKRIKKLTKQQLDRTKVKLSKRSIDLSGRVVGNLLVLNPVGRNNKSEWYWLCACDCGNITEIRGSHLRSGGVKSCGCGAYKSHKILKTTHNLTYTKGYTQQRNRKRDRKEAHLDKDWTPEMEDALRKFFPACVLCGMTEQEHIEKHNTSLQVDHVRPLHKGFGLSPSNSVILCSSHNQQKSAKDLSELPLEWQADLIWNVFKFKDHWDDKQGAF